MSWLAALGLSLGIALLAAGFVAALAHANTHPKPTREQPATVRLRAADATDHMPGQLGDDDQTTQGKP